MKTKLILFFLVLFYLPVRSQYKLPAFGKPDETELNMKECSFEKSADALKLIEEEEKEIIADYGLKVKTMRRVRIKIFTQKGFSAATIKIPYYTRTRGSKVTDIDAYIYYHDSAGKTVTEKVENDEIFRDKSNRSYTYLKFTFPHLQPGCVIEYRYQKKEKEVLHLEPWYFQDFIPTQYSAFTINAPADIDIISRLIGMGSVMEQTEFDHGSVDRRTYFHKTYLQRDISSFKPESMMSSVSDNLKRIEFAVKPYGIGVMSVFSSNKWMPYAEMLSRISFFGQQFEKVIPGTETIVDSAKKMNSREEKIRFIYQRVTNYIKWDNHQTFYTGDLVETWKERSGNSADINLALLNLLRRSGVPAHPLLISTRENGKTDAKFLSLGQFNGMDVLAPDSTETFILDGTSRHQSFNTPPQNILNRDAFIADTAYATWVFISDNRPLLKSMMNISASLSADGKMSGNVVSLFYDHSKVLRLADNEKTEDDEKEEDEKEFLKKDFTSLKTDSLKIENEDNDLLPLTERFNFTYEPSVSDKFIFIDPFFLSNFRKNPFTDSVRHSAIDFSSKQYLKTTLLVEIPENYEIDFLPANTRLRMADSSILFERVIHKQEGKIFFVNKMEVVYPLFDREEYTGLREFFNRMYAMLTEQIILKRKN